MGTSKKGVSSSMHGTVVAIQARAPSQCIKILSPGLTQLPAVASRCFRWRPTRRQLGVDLSTVRQFTATFRQDL